MSIESAGAGPSDTQARYIAQKRKELDAEQTGLQMDTALANRDRLRAAAGAKEKTDQEVVAISKAGEKQVETVRKLNSERLRTLEDSNQQSYQKLADTTATQIKRMEADSLKTIDDHKASSMERIQTFTSRSEDPFYRIKSLNPLLSQTEHAFEVKVALPPQEAENLFVSGEGQSLKLSLARRFQDRTQDAEKTLSTKTSSFQTVVESLNLPSAINIKGIKKAYADGVVTITVPKAGLPPPVGV